MRPWEIEDGRVGAVWEYDDRSSYERIQGAVAARGEVFMTDAS